MLRWHMASYYIRKDSPFYWIRVRRPDGSWGQKSSRLRHDEKGVLRKLHAMVADAFLVAMRQGCRLREVEIPLSSIDTEFSDLSRWLIGIL